MKRRIWAIQMVVTAVAGPLSMVSVAQQVDAMNGAESARTVFERTCSGCHSADKARGRSLTRDQWEALVTRMQGHAEEAGKAFAGETAQIITAYLAGTTGQAEGSSAEEADEHGEEHEEELGEVGEILGVVTAVLVVCMIGSGLLRRKLKRHFRPLHATMAIGLVATVLGHGTILYLHTGPPDSLWHASGSLGLLALLGTATGGLLRKKLGKAFIKLHATGATASLVLIVLHRVLA